MAYEQGESMIGGVNFSQDRIQHGELVTDSEIDAIRKSSVSEEKDNVEKNHTKKEK